MTFDEWWKETEDQFDDDLAQAEACWTAAEIAERKRICRKLETWFKTIGAMVMEGQARAEFVGLVESIRG